MGHRNDQKNRRPDTFHESRVKEILPSHIRENYPSLLNFLDAYYDFMDSDGSTHGFDNKIHEILALRDIEEAPEEFLKELTYELASRLENNEKFTYPRIALQRLAYLYREKGTPKGIEEFFKTFFQTDVEVIYPKKDIFIVGEDEIGPDFEHYIQDYKLYQNYSLLLKLGLSRFQYETLYKKFMHPAGWYFEGETSFATEANMPIGVSDAIEDSAIISYISSASPLIFHQSRFTEIVDLNTGNDVYVIDKGGSVNLTGNSYEDEEFYYQLSPTYYWQVKRTIPINNTYATWKYTLVYNNEIIEDFNFRAEREFVINGYGDGPEYWDLHLSIAGYQRGEDQNYVASPADSAGVTTRRYSIAEEKRVDMLYQTIQDYQQASVAQLQAFYTVGNLANINSHTFDEEELYEVDWSEIETALLQAAAFNTSGYLYSFLVSDRGDGYLYGDINLSNQGGTQVFGPGAPITSNDASEAQDYGNNGTTGTQAYDDHIEQYFIPELRRLRRSDPATYNAAFTSTPTDDPVMDFSNIFEKTDNDMHTRYDPFFHHVDSSL